jgi:hypothetical protein
MQYLGYVALALLALTPFGFFAWLRLKRESYIRGYRFPPGTFRELLKQRPGLEPKDQQLVARALRQFFLAYLAGRRRPVSMPSQVADELWHAFILDTRRYQDFCRYAFGRFMHHMPASSLGRNRDVNAGLRRVFWHACREENINPRRPTRLPLLFAIDRKLGISDGFVYELDCRAQPTRNGQATQCVESLSDSSVDGTTDGFGNDSSGGDSGGGDGGCGGGD